MLSGFRAFRTLTCAPVSLNLDVDCSIHLDSYGSLVPSFGLNDLGVELLFAGILSSYSCPFRFDSFSNRKWK